MGRQRAEDRARGEWSNYAVQSSAMLRDQSPLPPSRPTTAGIPIGAEVVGERERGAGASSRRRLWVGKRRTTY